MKKLILMLAMMLPMMLVSCSDGEAPAISESQEEQEGSDDSEKEEYNITGTWSDGNYFVSFGKDGSYCAFLNGTFIDSGYYKIEDNTVTCENKFFNRITTYSIIDIDDNKIKADVVYSDVNGNAQKSSINFSRSEEVGCEKDSPLVGRNISWNTWGEFGTITMEFNTYNSGVKSASKGTAKKYPLDFFYIYNDSKLYYQIIRNSSIQVPSIGGWSTGYYDVVCWEITISSNGNIDFEKVELS